MASFKTSSDESCQRCSLCYVSDTYNKSEFISEIEANDATSELRADVVPDETVVLDRPICQRRSYLGRRSITANDSAKNDNGQPLHVPGHGLNFHRPVQTDSLPVGDGQLDTGGQEVRRRTSASGSMAADGTSKTSSHSDDTCKGNNTMLYVCVLGYQEIRRREWLKKGLKSPLVPPANKDNWMVWTGCWHLYLHNKLLNCHQKTFSH